jgi:hypothetical protein
MDGKHEEADVIDHEAVTEPSDSLGLDSTMAQPCGYIMLGSKKAKRRSGMGLIMVQAGAVTPTAESRQRLQY